MRRYLYCLVGLVCLSSGCQMLEWVQPHQLWKWNRQKSMMRDDAYFSIPAQPISDKQETKTQTHLVKPF